MTGYGKASSVYQDKKITAEIKSLNSKALDLSTRITPAYREKEMEVRGMVSKVAQRGKVEFALWIERDEASEATPINGKLLRQYYNEIMEACNEQGLPQPADVWPLLMRMPDVTLSCLPPEVSQWRVVSFSRSAVRSISISFAGSICFHPFVFGDIIAQQSMVLHLTQFRLCATIAEKIMNEKL